jgi:toxin YoeB
LRHWVDVDKRTVVKILHLVEAVMDEPLAGIGKREPPKHEAAGAWSIPASSLSLLTLHQR